MFSETLNTMSTFILITFFIECLKEGQNVRFSATENSTHSQLFHDLSPEALCCNSNNTSVT